jgi:hypothetical protein
MLADESILTINREHSRGQSRRNLPGIRAQRASEEHQNERESERNKERELYVRANTHACLVLKLRGSHCHRGRTAADGTGAAVLVELRIAPSRMATMMMARTAARLPERARTARWSLGDR